jgi:hypothetical protein
MDEHKHDQAVSDEALDRELAALLQVEPSPEFVARVRADVSAEAIADRWLSGRWLAVAAAAVVVIIGASIVIGTRPAQAPAETTPFVAEQPPVAPRIEPRDAAIQPPATVSSPAQTAAVAAPPSSTSEVVVSPREAAGLHYLLAALHEGRLDSAVMPNIQSDDIADMPIAIEPITVEPLVAAADLETGAGQ